MYWIRTDEELPPYNENVLVFYCPKHPDMGGNLIGIDKRTDTRGTSLPKSLIKEIEANQGFRLGQVSHWMTLPEKPKQGPHRPYTEVFDELREKFGHLYNDINPKA